MKAPTIRSRRWMPIVLLLAAAVSAVGLERTRIVGCYLTLKHPSEVSEARTCLAELSKGVRLQACRTAEVPTLRSPESRSRIAALLQHADVRDLQPVFVDWTNRDGMRFTNVVLAAPHEGSSLTMVFVEDHKHLQLYAVHFSQHWLATWAPGDALY